MDGFTIDALLAEIRPVVVGRHVSRTRLGGPRSLVLELAGRGSPRLWIETGRTAAGIYLMTREEARALEAVELGDPDAGARQALLHLRKHVDGRRIVGLRRVVGERVIELELGELALSLRVGGRPAASLGAGERLIATLGDAPPAWPPPPPAPEREAGSLDAAALERLAPLPARERPRALLRLFPVLGRELARALAADPGSLEGLRERLSRPAPTLRAPAALAGCPDVLLVPESALALLPCALPGVPSLHPGPRSWSEAATAFLGARRRGDAFASRQRRLSATAVAGRDRLKALLDHLAADLAGLPKAASLRETAGAILASAARIEPGARRARVPDPSDEARTLDVALDPALSPARNADRLYERARRVDRASREIAARLASARARLDEAEAEIEALAGASRLSDLEARGRGREAAGSSPPRRGPGGPRRYLTTGGLELLVGRGARENHELTFSVARPDDLWLHARDAPGAHVVLRDNEGRARADDLREAAEVAAFFSGAAGSAAVDVHVARRKHLRPAGGPGRVRIAHSETLRVAPRDPEGRLRRR